MRETEREIDPQTPLAKIGVNSRAPQCERERERERERLSEERERKGEKNKSFFIFFFYCLARKKHCQLWLGYNPMLKL